MPKKRRVRISKRARSLSNHEKLMVEKHVAWKKKKWKTRLFLAAIAGVYMYWRYS